MFDWLIDCCLKSSGQYLRDVSDENKFTLAEHLSSFPVVFVGFMLLQLYIDLTEYIVIVDTNTGFNTTADRIVHLLMQHEKQNLRF